MTLFWMVLDAFGPGSTHLVVIPWNNARRLSNPGGLFFRDASWDFNLNKTLFRRNQWMYPLVNIHITMENHHVQWENRLFLWPFSIAMLNYQRVICNYIYSTPLLIMIKSLKSSFYISICDSRYIPNKSESTGYP